MTTCLNSSQEVNKTLNRTTKVFFLTVVVAVIFTHYQNIHSKITPEPGVAISVYSMNALIYRNGGDTSIGHAPSIQYQAYLNEEFRLSKAWKQNCEKYLKGRSTSCQASNTILDDELIQEYRANQIPAVFAGLFIPRATVEAFRDKTQVPDDKHYNQERSAGIVFFFILLIFKLLIWISLFFCLRSRISALYFGCCFLLVATWGLICDLLGRGAGVYAVDRMIRGSDGFDETLSVTRAISFSLFSALKPLIAPAYGHSIYGLAPRSTTIFIAFAIIIPIVIAREWKFIWLAPLGFGTHFMTFCLLFAFTILALTITRIWPQKQDGRHVVGSAFLCLIVLFFQLKNLTYAFLLPATVLLILIIIISITRSTPISDLHVVQRHQIGSLSIVSIGLLIFLLIGTVVILANTFYQTDTQGFWKDGFLREGVGRLAPFTMLFLWVLPIVHKIIDRISLDKIESMCIQERPYQKTTLMLSSQRIDVLILLFVTSILLALSGLLTRSYFL